MTFSAGEPHPVALTLKNCPNASAHSSSCLSSELGSTIADCYARLFDVCLDSMPIYGQWVTEIVSTLGRGPGNAKSLV